MPWIADNGARPVGNSRIMMDLQHNYEGNADPASAHLCERIPQYIYDHPGLVFCYYMMSFSSDIYSAATESQLIYVYISYPEDLIRIDIEQVNSYL